MALYFAGFTTAAAAAGGPFIDLRSTSTSMPAILEIGLFATAATANTFSLERSTAVGTASTTVAGVPGNPAVPAAAMTVGTAWSTNPTASNLPLLTATFTASVGAGVVWGFDRDELLIGVSSSLVVVNRGAAAGSITRGWVKWRE